MDNLEASEVLRIYKGKTVLVTGSTGFKGAWLCHWLQLLGAKVVGVSLPAGVDEPRALYMDLKLKERIMHYDADICDFEAMYTIFLSTRPDFVFHLAAQSLVRPSYEDPKATFDTNISGSVNLLECVRRSQSVQSLIYVTTDKCYKNKEWLWGYRENDELGGHDPYSASKSAAEMVFHSYLQSFFVADRQLAASSVRAGNVIGGGDWSSSRIVPDCFRSLYQNQSISIRNPRSTRPWQHVLDPLYGYLLLAALQFSDKSLSGSWNFGPESDSNQTVMALVSAILDSWGGGDFEVRAIPNAVHEASLLQLNCDKAKSLLGWKHRWNFESTIRQTTEWYKSNQNKEDMEAVTTKQISDFMGAYK